MEKKIMITLTQEWFDYAENLCLEDFGVVNLSVLFVKLLNKHKKEQIENFGMDTYDHEIPVQPVYNNNKISIQQELQNKEQSRTLTAKENEMLLIARYGTKDKPAKDVEQALNINSTRANRNNNFKSIGEDAPVNQFEELPEIDPADFEYLNTGGAKINLELPE